jgi:hypothetical protein
MYEYKDSLFTRTLRCYVACAFYRETSRLNDTMTFWLYFHVSCNASSKTTYYFFHNYTRTCRRILRMMMVMMCVCVCVCVWGGRGGGGSAHEAVARVLTHDPDGLGLIRVVDDVLITASKAPSEMDRVVALAQK